MGSYKYLHRFQIINCAECESTDQLTVNEYTDNEQLGFICWYLFQCSYIENIS